MTISIIVAVAENQVIGAGNKLIWHLPDDLKNFKKITMGKYLIMGRKTWESINKPLPGRTNIIITRDPDYTAKGCLVFNSFEAALEYAENKGQDEIFIIGGGEIYLQALPLADKIYLTRVHAAPQGDTRFPKLDEKKWQVVAIEKYFRDERHAYDFDILELHKVKVH